jgi:hypothetical protein
VGIKINYKNGVMEDLTKVGKRWLERVMGVISVDLIRYLEDDATYFGIVTKISVEEKIPLSKAYSRVEDARLRVGLKPRFTSYYSFVIMRGRFLKNKGAVRFFNYKEYDI